MKTKEHKAILEKYNNVRLKYILIYDLFCFLVIPRWTKLQVGCPCHVGWLVGWLVLRSVGRSVRLSKFPKLSGSYTSILWSTCLSMPTICLYQLRNTLYASYMSRVRTRTRPCWREGTARSSWGSWWTMCWARNTSQVCFNCLASVWTYVCTFVYSSLTPWLVQICKMANWMW